jgi:SSS family solute:Na+ symporter
MGIIDWSVFVLFILVIFWGSILAIKKKATMFDFALDGQRTPAILVFATLSASFIGPGFTLGVSEQGFLNGPFYTMILVGFSIQTIIVGLFLAPLLRAHSNVYTVGDVMERYYGKTVKIITGVISVFYSAGIVGICARASGLILEGVAGIPFMYGAIFITLFVIIYCAIGGMPSVIYTDVIQFIILALGISILLISIYNHIPDFNSFLVKLPEGFYNPFQTIPLIKYFGFFLGFLLGETLVPPYTNRAFISKQQSDAKTGFILSGIISIFWFCGCITVGMSAKILHPEISSSQAFTYMALHYLPTGLMGMMLIVMISVVLSTLSSFLNSGSVSFVRDIMEPLFLKSENKSVYIAKIVTIVIGLIAILFAILAPGLVEGLLIAYTLWAPTIVLPLIIALISKGRVHKISGLISIITGTCGVIIWKWVFQNPFGTPELIIGVFCNQLGFWITEMTIRKRKEFVA